MPKRERFKTDYTGVYYTVGYSAIKKKPEKIFYIRYRKNGKLIEEPAGRQFKDKMTAAQANNIRSSRITGDSKSNRERRKEIREKKLQEDNRWTIEKLWKEYKANKPKLKGIVADENRFEKHLKPVFGDKEPSEIIPLDVDRLRIKLLRKKRKKVSEEGKVTYLDPLKPGTVKNILELLRRIVIYAKKKKICQSINFTIEMPEADNERTEDLTPEQLNKLLEAIENDTNTHAANMMKLALFTGMRRGEMFKLKWADIDFEKGFIHLKEPKGKISQKIPLNDGARKVLENHTRSKSSFVFPGRKGKQRTDIKHQVNRIKDKAGLPKDFRALHGLRHVYASMLASSGQVDMYTLQKLLTHKNPAMTQRYAHLRDDALKGAADLAGNIINQAVADAKKKKVVSLKKK